MKLISVFVFIILSFGIHEELTGQNTSGNFLIEAAELDNSIFKADKYWRGADGAATIDLENGTILWLFSDTFINPKGNGERSGSVMINNTLAIQEGSDLQSTKLRFYWKGTNEEPKSFFDLPGETWFWLGHGTVVNGKLLIFLGEIKSSTKGLGFESVGWSLAIIDNPNEDPGKWNINYIQGSKAFGIVVGFSSVVKEGDFVYAFGVKEPGTHNVYLLRFKKDKVAEGDLSNPEWWTGDKWERDLKDLPESAVLFEGQTEFSVHFDNSLKKYIQIQTLGFGHSSLGYRLADQLQGPWSKPVVFYTPQLQEGEFNYTANAHPELKSDGILVTYNINNFNFEKLVNNENIYFPRLIKLKLKK